MYGKESLDAVIPWLLRDELRTSRRLLASWRSRHEAKDLERWRKHWEEAYGIAAAAREEPGEAHGQYRLGVCLWHLGRHDEAMERYREAMRLDPAYTEIVRWHEGLVGRLARG